MVIGLGVLGLAVIVVLVLVVNSGSGGSGKPTAAARASSPSTASPAASRTTTAGATTTSSATSSAAAKVIAQINLTPTVAGSKAAGIAEVLREGTTDGVAIVAQHVTPNATRPANAYAVWLYNSSHSAVRLGFVNPGVTSSGKLSTAGGLPANAASYKELIVTLETTSNPSAPGPIILRGALPAGV